MRDVHRIVHKALQGVSAALGQPALARPAYEGCEGLLEAV